MKGLGHCCELVLSDFFVSMFEVLPALVRVVQDFSWVFWVSKVVSDLGVVVIVETVEDESGDLEIGNFFFLT